MVSQKFITEGPKETYLLAKRKVEKIKSPKVFCLYGELGSGKTTFVSGLASGFKIKKRIISPSFLIIKQYKSKNKHFYHIDLYRLKNLNDIKSLGIEEILKEKNSVIVIEWPEMIKEILPKKRIDIYFKYLEDNKREIEINYHNG